MNNGWIKLHRKLKENPYMNRPAYLSVWVYLLWEAEHGMKKVGGEWLRKEQGEMKSIIWKGERIYLKPGQLTCGLKQLSQWTGVPRGTCKRVLDCFKNETMIETETSNRFSLITVNKWDKYQMNETQNETQMKRQRNASETPVKTPKECKEGKNVNIHTREDFEKFWQSYPNKKAKPSALKAFQKIDVPPNTLLEALEKQKDSATWQKDGGQFIPYPATWLNQRRWEDEIAVTSSTLPPKNRISYG